MRTATPGSARFRGYSVVELMIVVLILAIALTFGLPSFLEAMRNNAITARTNEFVASVNLARSEAVKRATSAQLCVSSDGASCTGSDWDAGWLVLADADRDGLYEPPGETVRVVPATEEAVMTAERSSIAVNAIEFNNRGFLVNGGAIDTVNRVLTLEAEGCYAGEYASRGLTIVPTGRVAVTPGTCS